jgi:hypothetical protein
MLANKIYVTAKANSGKKTLLYFILLMNCISSLRRMQSKLKLI